MENIKKPHQWIHLNDQYQFLGKKARGTFGVVYRAKHRKTGKIVAVKHMLDIFRHNYSAKKTARELAILY